MGQISVKIQNRTYRLSCDDGEEDRLSELAGYVRSKADRLIEDYGRIGDDHLMLMSAILIADELYDERAGGEPPAGNRGPTGEARAKPEKTTVTAAN